MKKALGWWRGRSRTSTRVGVALLIIVVLLAFTLPSGAAPDASTFAIQIACIVLGGVAVLRPLLAGTVIGMLLTLLLITPSTFMGMAFLAVMVPVAVSAKRGHRIWALVFVGWYFAVSVALTARNVTSTLEMAQGVNFWLVYMFAPLLLGEIIRQVQERADRHRIVHAEATERQRRAIARDLHDTLAYATTTMVMRAEQARLRGNQDAQTLGDLDFIAATGRSATADLRTMLAMLRDPELSGEDDLPGLLPASRLEEVIAGQVMKLQAFDFEVNAATNGDPRALPERLATVVSRVITEAASNITKHGDPGHEVTLMVDLEGPEVEAVFVNAVRHDEPTGGHSGMGLLGLQEIVGAEGGTLSSSLVGDRWITHLSLPAGDQTRGGDQNG